MTMRKEGDVYLVNFVNRLEIKSFEAAKHITNGLVIEGKNKAEVSSYAKASADRKAKVKENLYQREEYSKMNFSKYSTRKNRPDSGIGWGERHGQK